MATGMYCVFMTSQQCASTYCHPCLMGSFHQCSQLDEELAHFHLLTAHLGQDKKKYEIGDTVF